MSVEGSRRAALIGIDWGTTHRRAYLIESDGQCRRAHADDQGLLAARGRFAEALAAALAGLGESDTALPIVMSGMVGSVHGWHEVPYLDTAVPLTALGRHLYALPADGGAPRRYIVPGYRCDGPGAAVEVMRGEETQVLGAVALGQRDGWFVLPGTHSKWVLLREARIERIVTYMTGELFGLLAAHGTLAPLMVEPPAGGPPADGGRPVPDAAPAGGPDAGRAGLPGAGSSAAFAAGLAAARGAALSNVLFGARARVVTGRMPAGDARAYLSGALIGAELHDVAAREPGRLARATLIGAPELAARYRAGAALLGFELAELDPRAASIAAFDALRRALHDDGDGP